MAQIQDQRNKKNDNAPLNRPAPQEVVLSPSIEMVNVVQPGVYIPPDAGLYLTFINQVTLPVTLAIKFRYLDVHPSPNGVLNTGQKVKESTHIVTLTDASRVKTSVVVPQAMNDVYVLDVNINTLVGQIQRATTFVCLYFSRSALGTSTSPIVGVLCAGYLANDKPLTLGEKEYGVSGKGHMRYIAVPAPAAGSNFTYTVETNTRVKVKSVRFLFQTSAQVANRAIRLTIKEPVGVFLGVHEVNAVQTASLNSNYVFAPNLAPRYAQVNAGDTETPMIEAELLENSKIATSITNIQTGDQLSAIEIQVEEWYDPTGTSGIGGGGGGEKGES